MAGKGPESRMSDECLITLETVFLYYNDCQAVMRKFTLAGKTDKEQGLLGLFLLIASEQSSWVSEPFLLRLAYQIALFIHFG